MFGKNSSTANAIKFTINASTFQASTSGKVYISQTVKINA